MDKKAIVKKAIKDGKGGWGRGTDPRIAKSTQGIGGKFMDVARGVVRMTGGKAATDYAGSKMAKLVTPKANRKYVPDTTSGKDALKSVGSVSALVAPLPFLPVAKGASMGIRALRRILGGKKASRSTNFGDSATPRPGYVKNAMKPSGEFTRNKKIIIRNSIKDNIKNIRFDK